MPDSNIIYLSMRVLFLNVQTISVKSCTVATCVCLSSFQFGRGLGGDYSTERNGTERNGTERNGMMD